METRGLFWLWSVLLIVVLNYATAEETPSYFTVGGDLTLDPGPFTKDLTNILWKNEGSLVADWVKEKVPLTYYKTYKGRAELDIKTGALIIRNMRKEDAGLFTVEINSQVLDRSFRVEAVVALKKPKIWIRPLTCGPSMERCTLTCETDTKQAGPITYTWWRGGEQLSPNTMELEITKGALFKTFTCSVKNPVSVERSEPIANPLYEEKLSADDDDGVDGGAIAGAVIGVLVLVLVLGAAGLAYWKREDILKLFSERFGNADPPPPNPQTNGNSTPLLSGNEANVTIPMDRSNKVEPSENHPPAEPQPPVEAPPPQPPVDAPPPQPPVDAPPPQPPGEAPPPQPPVDSIPSDPPADTTPL